MPKKEGDAYFWASTVLNYCEHYLSVRDDCKYSKFITVHLREPDQDRVAWYEAFLSQQDMCRVLLSTH